MTTPDDKKAPVGTILMLLSGVVAIVWGRRPRDHIETSRTASLTRRVIEETTAVATPADFPAFNLIPGHPPSKPAPKTSWGDAKRGVAIDISLLALGLAAAAAIALGGSGVVRLLIVFVAASLIPGGALLTRLETNDVATALGLALGLSLGVEAVGALVMVWTGWWHPLGFSILLVAAACLLLGSDLQHSIRTLRSGTV